MKKKPSFLPKPTKNDEGQKGRFYASAIKKVGKRLNLRQKKG